MRVLLIAAFLAAFSCPAEADHCGTRDYALDQLAREYKEAPTGAGVTSNGALVELLTTDDGATWTIIITYPNGLTCLLSAGEGWRELEPEEGDAA